MDNIKISYAIPVCNEIEEFSKLMTLLISEIRDDDEIVVQFDSNNGTDVVREYLNVVSNIKPNIKVIEFPLNGDFSEFKNNLKNNCSKDYIFQLDADELVSQQLLSYLPSIILSNQVDIFFIPRINTVDGITNEWITKWGWKLSKIESETETKEIIITNDEYKLLKDNNFIIEEKIIENDKFSVFFYKPIINFPDVQCRILKNTSNLKWKNKVHETIIGYETFTILPSNHSFCLYHHKSMDRQIKQNELYSKL